MNRAQIVKPFQQTVTCPVLLILLSCFRGSCLVIECSTKGQKHQTIGPHSFAGQHECLLHNSQGAGNPHQQGGVGQCSTAHKKLNKITNNSLERDWSEAAALDRNELTAGSCPDSISSWVRDNFVLSDSIRIIFRPRLNAKVYDPASTS